MNKALQTMEWMAPGGNLNAYIQGTATVPMLTIDEERALGESLYYEEDLDAARRMVMAHLRFVVHIARSYNGYGLPLADLIQEGNVGLMKAVRRFNPEKGVRLVSFAVHWIKAEIHEFILRNWRIVKIATTKAQRKLFFNLRSAKKQLQWLTADEAEAVAEDLGVQVKDVMEMEMRLTARDSAFDAPTDDDDDNSWLGIQIDKTGRMFDLCVYWVDGKDVCVVYECDPCDGDDGEPNGNWTTNTNAEWYLTDEDEDDGEKEDD